MSYFDCMAFKQIYSIRHQLRSYRNIKLQGIIIDIVIQKTSV